MRHLGGEQKGAVDAQSATVLLFVVAVIIGGFWYVLQHRKDAQSSNVLTQKVADPSVAANNSDLAPQSYRDPDGGFMISYPSAWQLNQTYSGTGSETIHSASLNSPSGSTRLEINYKRNYIETDCIPGYYDVPFASSNRCFSAEYLTADDIHVPAYQDGWYLVHYHFKTITINAKEVYTSCLVVGMPTLNQPKMGFFADHPISHVLGNNGSDQGYLSACVDAGTKLSDYNKPEVQVGESILRSLRFE